MGTASAGKTGQGLGVGVTVRGTGDWGRDGCGGRRCSEDGRSTLHKGSRYSGSKSRKAADGGVSDIKGRSAGVVTCRQRRSIAIGRVRSLAISSWRRRGNVTGVAAIKIDNKVRSREGA